MTWRVQANNGRGWVNTGIVETNFRWASQFWTALRLNGRTFRLVPTPKTRGY